MLASFSSYAVRSGDISSVGTAANDPLVFPSVAQSIIEVQEITFSDVLNYIYPSELIVNLAILSFGIAIVFIPSLVWFIPLAALSLLSVRMGGRMTMFGSPVNAQKQADIVNAITGGEGRVQQACHQNDFVCRSFGSNPATLATLT